MEHKPKCKHWNIKILGKKHTKTFEHLFRQHFLKYMYRQNLAVYNRIIQSINNFARMQFWNIKLRKKMASQTQWENVYKVYI